MHEPGGEKRKVLGTACLVIGMASGLNPKYLVLHEVWAGLLVALAIGVHRPGKWGWSLAAAGAALAIREHALPFVLLLGAMAVWRRDWREAGAWGVLVLAFLRLPRLARRAGRTRCFCRATARPRAGSRCAACAA